MEKLEEIKILLEKRRNLDRSNLVENAIEEDEMWDDPILPIFDVKNKVDWVEETEW